MSARSAGARAHDLLRRALRKLDTVLVAAASRETGAGLALQLLRLRGWQRAALKPIEDLASQQELVVAGPSPFCVEAPRWIGTPPVTRAGEFPAISARVLRDAIAAAYSPAIVLSGAIHLPGHLIAAQGRIVTAPGGLYRNRGELTVASTRADSCLSNGILVGGAGAFNWYHFVIECLPKAYLARSLPAEFDEFPLLVPDECRRIASFAAALESVAAGRRIHYLPHGERVRVGRLVAIDDVSIGPFNLVAGEWPRIDDYRQHDAVLRAFFSELRSRILGPNTSAGTGRRIFVKRPGNRRSYNQEELVAIAEGHGFEAISPETLSFQQQAKLFSEAAAIIGPSGAAWVGMIFREEPLTGLSWLPRPYQEFCGYSALAKLLGHRLDFIEAKTARELRSTGEGYTSEYEICPHEFEKAVATMTGDIATADDRDSHAAVGPSQMDRGAPSSPPRFASNI